MSHSAGNNPHLTPGAAAAAAERMPFQRPPSNASLPEKTRPKPELVRRCICLLNMLLDWPAPRMAVTERFVRVGIRAGYRWWIIYWKKSPPSLPFFFLAGWRKTWGRARRRMKTQPRTDSWQFIYGQKAKKRKIWNTYFSKSLKLKMHHCFSIVSK